VHQQSLLAAIIAVASAAAREITVVVMPLDVSRRLGQFGELVIAGSALPDRVARRIKQALARLLANDAWNIGGHFV
jgi:hypothetical protein